MVSCAKCTGLGLTLFCRVDPAILFPAWRADTGERVWSLGGLGSSNILAALQTRLGA